MKINVKTIIIVLCLFIAVWLFYRFFIKVPNKKPNFPDALIPPVSESSENQKTEQTCYEKEEVVQQENKQSEVEKVNDVDVITDKSGETSSHINSTNYKGRETNIYYLSYMNTETGVSIIEEVSKQVYDRFISDNRRGRAKGNLLKKYGVEIKKC